MQSTLDARLASAAKYVRQGAVFADIGTDHAHLPIYLLQTGVIQSAIAADIAEGPLSLARENAKKHNLLHKMSFYLTDGLASLSELGITDIAICGMGGEMIKDIISREDFVKSPDVRLILQAMSKQERLRRFLCENGFQIVSETLARASGRVYSCICAHYTGTPYALTEAQCLVGEPTLECDADIENYRSLIDKKLSALRRKIDGKGASNGQDATELATLRELENKRSKLDEYKRTLQ